MTEYEFHELALRYRRPTEQELNAIVESMQRLGFSKRKPIMIYQQKILDGCCRYAAAKIAGVEPRYDVFSGTPEEAADFVEMENGPRRHLTYPEQLALQMEATEMRRKRIAAARRDGNSVPAIADAEGISKSQVNRDLEKVATLSGGDRVVPETDKVTGRDGVARDPVRPKTVCDRCWRIAKKTIDRCTNCEMMAKASKLKPNANPEADKAAEKRKAEVAAAKAAKAPPPKPEKVGKPRAAKLDDFDKVIDHCLLLTKAKCTGPYDQGWNEALTSISEHFRSMCPTAKKPVQFTIPMNIDTPAFRTAWDDWIEYRRKVKRKPVNERAGKMQLADCSAWGEQKAIASIQMSIKSQYQALVECKEGGQSGKQRKSDPGARFDPTYQYGGSEKTDGGKAG